jgi:N-acyl-D-amino-acid deacylase
MSVTNTLVEGDPMTGDLLIAGGTVVDGSGRPGIRADVLVSDGRIVAIGDGLRADRTLDAAGCVVAPGFIDIHTHYDAQVYWDPSLTPSSFHGVTTVIAGNCGFSIAPTRPEHHDMIAETLKNVEDMSVPTLKAGIVWDFETFPEYLDSVARSGIRLNFGAYLGHTALRLFVMGDDAYHRAATGEEIAEMCDLLRQGLRAGAAGFSTSLTPSHRGAGGLPVPSRWAEREELDALLRVLGEEQRGIASFANPTDVITVEDLYKLQPEIGVPFTYAAILSRASGDHHAAMELNRRGWDNGAEVWPQVTPRPLAFAFSFLSPFTMNPNPAFAELMEQGEKVRRAAYANPEWRQRAVALSREQKTLAPRWDTFHIQISHAHPEMQGSSVVAIAKERRIEPLLAMIDLALDEPDLNLLVSCVIANDDPEEVGLILQEEHCAIGLSDAGAHVSQLCDAPQATDFLGNWVRERGIMSIESAVQRLSGAQADLLGLQDRGYLRPGLAGDIVVFDPETVAPGPVRRTRDFPADGERLTADQPRGIRHVLVNGVPICLDGHPVDVAIQPGEIIRTEVRPPRSN